MSDRWLAWGCHRVLDLWYDDIDLKLMAHIRMARLVAPSMRDRGGGAIVSVVSIGGRAPEAGSAPTSVSRAAGPRVREAAVQ